MTLYITKNGQQLGPYSLSEAQSLVAAGTLQPADWAWYEGLPDWIPLLQVPGFVAGSVPASASIAATPSLRATSSPVALARVRRPVLVWIICIFYFVTIPLGVASLAALPYLLSFTNKLQQRVADNLQTQADQATDPAQRDQLIAVLKQMRANEAQTKLLTTHGPIYYGYAIFSMLVSLLAAILLFLLRPSAFYAFIAAFIISLLGAIYNYAHTTFPSGGGAGQQLGILLGVGAAVFNWGVMLAIIFYVRWLIRQGVLAHRSMATTLV
jgi:hypothetical protein